MLVLWFLFFLTPSVSPSNSRRWIKVGIIGCSLQLAITALKKGAYLLKYGRRGKPKFCPFRLSNVQSTSDGADSTLSNPLCEESAQNSSKYSNRQRPMHEVTFSTEDKPKLLSQV
ncbi:uncharacterized protein LOC105802228 [Gossypium raimondii]|uniref:uncharacterized protein LOC105802228 n=1 Tax=Gossypium raimondii TaxID=29730 RepID=UPI00227BE3A2|nr:uncharacterized protein LOC105802228 [Gossypium raimondii]